ncbi:unnamed protein product [Gadus morhua 'NCC']
MQATRFYHDTLLIRNPPSHPLRPGEPITCKHSQRFFTLPPQQLSFAPYLNTGFSSTYLAPGPDHFRGPLSINRLSDRDWLRPVARGFRTVLFLPTVLRGWASSPSLQAAGFGARSAPLHMGFFPPSPRRNWLFCLPLTSLPPLLNASRPIDAAPLRHSNHHRTLATSLLHTL